MNKIETVEAYYLDQSPEIQVELKKMHEIIKEILPNAQEVISYGMPAFKMKGVVCYYAAAKKHLGFYPTNQPISMFESELKGYKHTKGAVQFPYGAELPKELIQAMVKYRLELMEEE